NARFNGPGHQLLAALRIGQSLGDRFALIVGGRGAFTLNDGDVTGTTVIATDPTLAAGLYGGLTNVELKPSTRDRSYVVVEGGAIVHLVDSVELHLSYAQTVWGRNTADLRQANVGVTLLAL